MEEKISLASRHPTDPVLNLPTPKYFMVKQVIGFFIEKIRPAFEKLSELLFLKLWSQFCKFVLCHFARTRVGSTDTKLDTKLPVVAQTLTGYQSRPTTSGAEKTSETPAGPTTLLIQRCPLY